MTDVVDSIRNYNAKRDPERLQRKYVAMRHDPFTFLRGTCHLFYEQLPEAKWLAKAPPVWVCGDLHLENVGSYKGDNRLVYFDLNDFDEGALAPASWELVRLLTSVHMAAGSLHLSDAQADHLCRDFLDTYAAELRSGKARWVERDMATGMVGDLLQGLRGRLRPPFLDSRTIRKGKHRSLRIDGRRALPVTDKQREKVVALIDSMASREDTPRFYRVLDVARRIAGTGSLGVDRFAILVEGKGSSDGNYLLDLKQARPSSLVPHLDVRQPAWRTDAERVVAVQARMQAISPAFFRAVDMGRKSYVLRGLQPSEDRLALADWRGKLERLEGVLQTMGKLVAWAQLRSSGRDGSATADQLIAFGEKRRWQGPLLGLAKSCTRQVQRDWKSYCKAFDKGAFPT
ncbi:DUF2252 domain-containing protein [Dyella jiangningensis]|uniref:DUF2252 domain-containing protein n=1 Tax=Dyella jiangningensis TaxID=1379159 RepID=UPI00240FE9F7|nr:DUF2252 domain-containing protein [Dyella jiangningensis]MDG2539498.1 DUF2252 domain-containing protein [Dyella jiangningensis]